MQAAERAAFLQGQQFVSAGKGPLLVLLHGFCESHLIFEGILPALATRYHVICPDMPGHGGQAWGHGWRSLDDAACWLRDLLDALAVERCVLVGHSLGGYVAASFAAAFPERLAGLGMLHSTALDDAPERRAARTKAMALVSAQGKEPYLRAFVPGLFHAPANAWLKTMRRIVAPTDVEAILALIRIMRDRPDRSLAVQQLQVPVMYITGDHDALVSPARTVQELQGLPIALLVRIPDASHMAMYEAPQKLIAALQSLMTACAPAQADGHG